MIPFRWAGAAAFCLAAGFVSPRAAAAQGGSQGARRDPEMEAPEVHDLKIVGVHAFETDEVRNSIATDESGCNSALYYFICLATKSSAVYTRYYLDRQELALDMLRIRAFYWRRGYRAAQVDTLVTPHGDDAVDIVIEVTEGEPTTVSSMRVTGVDSLFDRAQLARLVTVDTGAPFSVLALDSTVVNVRAALWELGHADAVVDTATAVDSTSRTVAVRVNAQPGAIAVVGSIRIVGLDELSATTVQNSLTLHRGDVFKRSELFRSQRNLYESLLFQRSTIDARGADSTKSITVAVTEADLRRVRASAGFNTIDFVQVDGRFTHFNFFGGARRFTAQATVGNLLSRQLQDEFIFQRALPPDFSGDADTFLRPTWLTSVEVRQPWFRSPLNTISIGAFAHRRATPLVVVDRGQGATASFTREVAPRANASLSYRFEVTRIEAGDVYFCVNFGVCDLATIGTLTGSQRLSPVTLLGSVDRSNDPLSPTQGYTADLELEHASSATASTYRYNRAVIEGTAYRDFWRGTLAGHVRIGRTWPLGSTAAALGATTFFGDDIIHPRKRFYAGGSRSVRGYGESQLGPRVLTVAPTVLRITTIAEGDTTYRAGCAPGVPLTACDPNAATLGARDFTARPLGSPAIAEGSVEYRFGIWGPVHGAVFLDGAVLPAGDDAFFTLDDNFMALTPGVGVRYESPVGPIRLDLGINPGGAEYLPVFTQIEENGVRRIVQLGQDLPPAQRPLRRYDPTGDATGFQGLLNRLTLHVSIGEAF